MTPDQKAEWLIINLGIRGAMMFANEMNTALDGIMGNYWDEVLKELTTRFYEAENRLIKS
jgi:hypothetical protein